MPQLMLINPRKRRAPARRKTRRAAAPKTKIVYRRARSRVATAAKRRVRRLRRNPAPRLGGGVMNDVMNAAIGAGGAVAVNMVYDFLPLPLAMKTGMGATAGKAAVAVALGMFGKRLMGRAAGQMAAGALTVIAYDAMRALLPVSAPVAGLGYMSPGLPAGYLPQQGMGEYLQDNKAFSTGMGEYTY